MAPTFVIRKRGDVQGLPSQAGISLMCFHNESSSVLLPFALHWPQKSSTQGRNSQAVILRVANITFAKLCIGLVDVYHQQRL